MHELLTAMESQTSRAVQLWMVWMCIVFLMSLIFARQHVQAQRTLMALVATAFSGYIVWTMTGNIHLLGLVHIIIWLPLAVYLWRSMLSERARRHDGEADIAKYYTLQYKSFFAWACLLFATIVISLIFDVRDIVLVMTGQK